VPERAGQMTLAHAGQPEEQSALLPSSSRRRLSRAMSRGFRSSAPKIGLKTKSVEGVDTLREGRRHPPGRSSEGAYRFCGRPHRRSLLTPTGGDASRAAAGHGASRAPREDEEAAETAEAEALRAEAALLRISRGLGAARGSSAEALARALAWLRAGAAGGRPRPAR
jgi:hypothetical protein